MCILHSDSSYHSQSSSVLSPPPTSVLRHHHPFCSIINHRPSLVLLLHSQSFSSILCPPFSVLLHFMSSIPILLSFSVHLQRQSCPIASPSLPSSAIIPSRSFSSILSPSPPLCPPFPFLFSSQSTSNLIPAPSPVLLFHHPFSVLLHFMSSISSPLPFSVRLQPRSSSSILCYPFSLLHHFQPSSIPSHYPPSILLLHPLELLFRLFPTSSSVTCSFCASSSSSAL